MLQCEHLGSPMAPMVLLDEKQDGRKIGRTIKTKRDGHVCIVKMMVIMCDD